MTIYSTKTLGNAIRHRRLALDLSQGELAERVGVSRKWIIDVEQGKSTVALGLVLRLLDALDLDLRVTPREKTATGDHAWPGTVTVDLDDLLRSYRR